jgi:hypothetical protein
MPDGKARTVLTAFKVSKEEAEAIKRASRAARLDKSEWMRNAVLSALGMA